MPRYYVGSKVAFTAHIEVDLESTDAPEITFTYKEGGMRGEQITVTPERRGEGLYLAEIVTTKPGNLYFRWDTDGALDTSREGVLNIAPTAFESTS